jgi:hypothetical protein
MLRTIYVLDYGICLSARQLTDDYGDVRMYAPRSTIQIGTILTSWELSRVALTGLLEYTMNREIWFNGST